MSQISTPSYLNGITNVELQYVDLLGRLRVIDLHPKRYLGAKTKGKNVDGSSVGFVPVENSDIKLVLLENSGMRLPWNTRTYRVMCDVKAGDGELKDIETNPRFILKRQIEKAKEKGFEMFSSAELEGFIFWGVPKGRNLENIPQHVRSTVIQNYVIEKLIESQQMKSMIDKKKVLREILISPRGFYGCATPLDGTKWIRQKLYEMLVQKGIQWEYSHPEVARQDQIEFSLRYSDVMSTDDMIITAKYLMQNYALSFGLVLTFMPKVITFDNGSGMHRHMSIRKDEKNIFFDKDNHFNLSQEGKFAIGGLFAHFAALAALGAPTPNSLKRLRPYFEAPTSKVWGPANRTVAMRVPSFLEADEARIEWRPTDALSNPFLFDAVALAAMVQGIEEKIDPGETYRENVWEHGEEFANLALPGTPRKMLDGLRHDSLVDEVLGPAKDKYIALREKEIDTFEDMTGDWDPTFITEFEYENYLVYV